MKRLLSFLFKLPMSNAGSSPNELPDPTTQVKPKDLVAVSTGRDSKGRATYSDVAIVLDVGLFPDEVCVTFEQGASIWVQRDMLRCPF